MWLQMLLALRSKHCKKTSLFLLCRTSTSFICLLSLQRRLDIPFGILQIPVHHTSPDLVVKNWLGFPYPSKVPVPVAFLLLCPPIAPALDRCSQVTATVSACSVGKGSLLSGNNLFRLFFASKAL